jgi:hypothetical protein
MISSAVRRMYIEEHDKTSNTRVARGWITPERRVATEQSNGTETRETRYHDNCLPGLSAGEPQEEVGSTISVSAGH